MADILAPFRAHRRPRGYRIITARPVPNLSIREIIAAVAAKHGLTPRDIISDRRTRAVIPARQEAMFLATRTTASLPTIAAQFRRDPTTIGHAARAYARRQAAHDQNFTA